ncbi:MAG: hypothetical protein ACFFB2_20280 [Promethearchaeota archaeon]
MKNSNLLSQVNEKGDYVAIIITGPSLVELIEFTGLFLLILWNFYILRIIIKNKRDIVKLREELQNLRRLS